MRSRVITRGARFPVEKAKLGSRFLFTIRQPGYL